MIDGTGRSSESPSFARPYQPNKAFTALCHCAEYHFDPGLPWSRPKILPPGRQTFSKTLIPNYFPERISKYFLANGANRTSGALSGPGPPIDPDALLQPDDRCPTSGGRLVEHGNPAHADPSA